MTGLAPRVVVVHRRTELDELLLRHGTRGQAAFFLQTRGRDLAEVESDPVRLVGRRGALDDARELGGELDQPQLVCVEQRQVRRLRQGRPLRSRLALERADAGMGRASAQ